MKYFQENDGSFRVRTPLIHAVATGNPGVAMKLIDFGAKVSTPDKITGQTPLHLAAWTRNLNMVKVLLDRGADVDALASDTFKRPGTPLLSILKKGYDINSDYEYEKQALIIKMLIDKGCDINLSRKQEFCPLGMCSLWKDYRSMQMLLDSGANATEVNPSSGKTPVMDILDSGDPKSLQIFIDLGADLFTSGKFGIWNIEETLLDHASAKFNFECVELMLNAGCKMSERTRNSIVAGCRKFLPLNEREQLFSGDVNVHLDDDSFFTVLLIYEEKRQALKRIVTGMYRVKALKTACRTILRRECHLYRPKNVEALPLPKAIKKYILSID